MQKAKWYLLRLAALAAVIHFLVVVTGQQHIYATLRHTVFKGQLSPDITEYTEFPSRTVEHADGQPWAMSDFYNADGLSEEDLRYHDSLGTVSFLVIHKDSLRFEQYWDGFGVKSRSNSFSMAKSIVGVLTGIALKRGEIDSLDQPVYWFLPEYDQGLCKELTVRHLLMMSTGIDFNESYLNPFAFPAKANYGDDLEYLISQYGCVAPAGEFYSYQSGVTQILALLLRQATLDEVSDYATKHLWRKIGAEHPALWSLDKEDGIEKAFCCFNSNARDFARLGKLYLNKGNWEGEQLLDSAFVEASIRPAGIKELDGSPCTRYGLHWWLTTHAGHEVFYMRGLKGQYVMVMPDLDLITVRLGHYRTKGKGYADPVDMHHYLDMAMNIIE